MIPIRIASRTVLSVLMVAGLALAVGGCGKKPDVVHDVTTVTVEKEKGYTVEILASGAPNPKPFECALSKGMRPDEDHVRWHNLAGKEARIRFTAGWPFMEPAESEIVIADGMYSAYYTLSPSASNTKYPYHIKNVPTKKDIPPDDPSVSAEP